MVSKYIKYVSIILVPMYLYSSYPIIISISNLLICLLQVSTTPIGVCGRCGLGTKRGNASFNNSSEAAALGNRRCSKGSLKRRQLLAT